MIKSKRANRIFKQYGKHIKATEKNLGSCIQLARYNYVDYKDLKSMAMLHKGRA